MGYTTQFSGVFGLNKALDDKTFEFLKRFNDTRRMARKVDAKYGVQGEFYTEDDRSNSVIDNNAPPITQPGLWCQWMPSDDRMSIEWDGGEKFYHYIEWIKYIISKVLAPRGYVLNGVVEWRGEEFHDIGQIEICDNIVNGHRLIVDYSINKLLGAPQTVTSPVVKTSPRPTAVNVDGTMVKSANPSKCTGISAITGKKTKHQIAKERAAAQTKILEDKIAELERQLKSSLVPKAETKALSIKDALLDKIRVSSEPHLNLDKFKELLNTLLK